MNGLRLKLQPWFDARRRFKLTHAEIQMARELGMNPKKFGSLANERQEPWKAPLREFIAACYRKSFKRELSQQVLSLEELVAREQDRRVQKRAKKAERLADPASSEQTPRAERSTPRMDAPREKALFSSPLAGRP